MQLKTQFDLVSPWLALVSSHVQLLHAMYVCFVGVDVLRVHTKRKRRARLSLFFSFDCKLCPQYTSGCASLCVMLADLLFHHGIIMMSDAY